MEKLPLIKVNNVSKKFRIHKERKDTVKETLLNIFRKYEDTDFYALRNISFDVMPGEFLGIIGKNGSGKSTLLKTIVGIYEQDEGTIDVNGTVVPFLELGVGFNPDLTGRDNIYLNGIILGMRKKEVQERFDKIVEFAEIKDFLDTPIKNYSSGMMVRLAFSIAIQINADIYILDEVLAVGDVAFQKKCINRLNELMNKDKTIIYVSHSMETVKKYCNRVIYLKDSKVCDIGDPEEVIQKYHEDLGM